MAKAITPYEKYMDQKQQFNHQHKSPGFFQLTFEEWHNLWLCSGHYEERGRLRHEYALYRPDPTQPFTIHNAVITTNSDRVRLKGLKKVKFLLWITELRTSPRYSGLKIPFEY